VTRKQLLYLVHRAPFPPNRGDRIRSYHMLRYLAERYDVSLATLADEPVTHDMRRELDRLCVQVAIEPVGRSRWVRAAGSLAMGRSATEGLFASPALRLTVRRWAAQWRFDATLVFCSSMVQYLNCPELAGVPAVIDLVDVDSQKWFDYAAKVSGLKRVFFQLEGRRLRRLEQSLPRRAQAITLVSEAEAELFRGFCPNDRTVAVANGVDLDHFRPQNDGQCPWRPLPDSERCSAVFVGALDYRANIDAVTWFAAEVWPLIRQKLPALTLGLVGRKPDPAAQRLAQLPGIRVFGSVPDVRPYVAAADMVIAPLRIARGIQNKVLEAMAMGKPVICSPAALEGIAAEPDRHLLVAEQPTQWQSVIADLAADDDIAMSLGMAARSFVERHHAWEATLSSLGQLVSPHGESSAYLSDYSPVASDPRPIAASVAG
jgi:sugar transferase (PEP-CTERM/EpsH1 system associated)